MVDTANDNYIKTNIYVENEEVTPVIDIENEGEDDIELEVENEVASEDEVEFYINDDASEYERMMMDFDESDEEGGNDNSDEEADEEVIIDKPFSNEQMPQIFGEFAPYFKNITESLFFCWMEKHHISKLDSFETFK